MSLTNFNLSLFQLFPALHINALKTKRKKIKMIGCTLQLDMFEKKNNFNSIAFSNNLNFYIGLKQYYKLNVNKDIYKRYHKEKKLGFYKKNNRFVNGSYIYPITTDYLFIKRRFILNLRTKKRLKTKDLLLGRFSRLLKRINKSKIMHILYLFSKRDPKMNAKKLHFYFTSKGLYNSGRSYSIFGIGGFFLHNKRISISLKHVYPKRLFFLYNINKFSARFLYLFKNYRKRQNYFLDYVEFCLSKIDALYGISEFGIINKMSFISVLKSLKGLWKEFMKIRIFLRHFLIISMQTTYPIRYRLQRTLHVFKLFFNTFFNIKNVYCKLLNFGLKLSFFLTEGIIKERFYPFNLLTTFFCLNRFVITSPINLKKIFKTNIKFHDFTSGLLTKRIFTRRQFVSRIQHRKRFERKRLYYYIYKETLLKRLLILSFGRNKRFFTKQFIANYGLSYNSLNSKKFIMTRHYKKRIIWKMIYNLKNIFLLKQRQSQIKLKKNLIRKGILAKANVSQLYKKMITFNLPKTVIEKNLISDSLRKVKLKKVTIEKQRQRKTVDLKNLINVWNPLKKDVKFFCLKKGKEKNKPNIKKVIRKFKNYKKVFKIIYNRFLMSNAFVQAKVRSITRLTQRLR